MIKGVASNRQNDHYSQYKTKSPRMMDLFLSNIQTAKKSYLRRNGVPHFKITSTQVNTANFLFKRHHNGPNKQS